MASVSQAVQRCSLIRCRHEVSRNLDGRRVGTLLGEHTREWGLREQRVYAKQTLWWAINLHQKRREEKHEDQVLKLSLKCWGDGVDAINRFSSVQSLSHVWLFATPRTAACQASLSITNSQRLLKFTSVESVVPSNHLILCCPLFLPPSIFPSIRVFWNESIFRISQSIGVSVSASVFPVNIQDWFPLGWTGWISLLFKGLSRVFSNTTVEKHQFFCAQLSL